MRDRVSAWLRSRELSSDRRAGQYARTKALTRQYAWVGRNWRTVLGLVAFILVVLPAVLLLPQSARGFAAGVWLTSGVWLLASTIVLASGTAPQIMGERGEQYTASELRRLKRRG